MKSYFISVISFLFLIHLGFFKAQAQSFFSMGLTYAQPFEGFSAQNYRPGGGFSMEYTSRTIFPRFLLNFQYGGYWDFIQSGTERFRPASAIEGSRMHVSNQSSALHGFFRVITKKANVRFYGDAFAGSRLFFSTLTTYDSRGWDDDDIDDVDWLTGKMTGYVGLGAGVQVRVAPHIFLDTRVSHAFSTGARYVDLASVNYDNGFLEYRTDYAAQTNMLQFYMGLTFQIGEDQHQKKKPKPQPKPEPRSFPDRPGPVPLPRS